MVQEVYQLETSYFLIWWKVVTFCSETVAKITWLLQ